HPAYLERLPAGSFVTRVREGLRLAVWDHGWLPAQCKRDGVDLLHSPFNYGLPAWAPCPRVLTLHDAIDFVYYRPARLSLGRARFAFDSWLARTAADRIIAVSEHAGHDIVRHLRVPSRKVSVIHEAADPRFHAPVSAGARARVRARYGLTGRYVFYVGGSEGRKNVSFLVRAMAAAKIDDV